MATFKLVLDLLQAVGMVLLAGAVAIVLSLYGWMWAVMGIILVAFAAYVAIIMVMVAYDDYDMERRYERNHRS